MEFEMSDQSAMTLAVAAYEAGESKDQTAGPRWDDENK
jgi:hypothetical protein